MEWIWFTLIGLIAGWLAGLITKGGGFGLIGNLVVGVIGAVLGAFLFRLVGIGGGNLLGQLVIATVGALVLLFVIGFISKK